MSNEEQPKRKPLMTWVEMLVVLTIIGMLVALLLPAQQSTGHDRPRIRCFVRMGTLALALHTYHDAYQSLPPAYTVDAEGKPLHSWRVLVLPYLEADDIYRQIRLDEPWDSEYNQQFHDLMPGVFACLAARLEKGETTYQLVTGPDTYFPDAECRAWDDIAGYKADILLLVEVKPACCWMAPIDMPTGILGTVGVTSNQKVAVDSNHKGGTNVVMADGTVEFVKHGDVLSAKRKEQSAK